MANMIYDVAIVGYGPAGAIAASILGKAGFQVYVCDKDQDVYEKPRAIALDHEILRVFQNIGIVEEILPFCEPFTDSCYYGVDGKLIRQLTMVSEPYPLGYVPSMVFTQPPLERAIRKYVSQLKNVYVQTQTVLLDFQQDDEGVDLNVQLANAQPSIVRAKYLIGCDGASSTVRKGLDIKLEDLDFHEPWLVVDVQVNEKGLEKLPQTSAQYCEPERPTTYIIGPDNHRRWEISLKVDEDPAYQATPEGTWQLLERWLEPDDGCLWRQASYVFHALVAEKWRDGRVFIAGDAAHQQPPFLGQGMCQGVRDVVNLCWKLESILTHSFSQETADVLLNSYGLERKQHVKDLIETIKKIGAVICERDLQQAKLRDQNLLNEHDGAVKPLARQDILPLLSKGLISNTPASGSIFPQPLMIQEGQEKKMDEIIPHGWMVLTIEPMQFELPQDIQLPISIICIGADLQEKDQILKQWFEKNAVRAAIVRPDHYVFATAQNAQELMDQLNNLRSVLKLHEDTQIQQCEILNMM